MKQYRYLRSALPLVVLGLCAGCSDSSSSRIGADQSPAPNSADFNNFVVAQFVVGASETATPIQVDATQFNFPDDNDPGAFDFIISATP